MIVVAGEALVDLTPQTGPHGNDGRLAPLPGGSPYNVAVGLGRLGCEVAFLGGVSTDGFGELLAGRLRTDGVDLALSVATEAPTTLAVVHLDDAGRAGYRFYLAATSAAALDAEALPALPDGAALHVSFGALTARTEPGGVALASLLERERGQRLRSLDPNVRPSMIDDLATYAARIDELAADVELVKVSDEDLAWLHPDRDPVEVARDWAAAGAELVVITRGPRGATALRTGHPPIEVPGVPVEVADTIGAGDAFTSALLAWLDRRGDLTAGALAGLADDEVRGALTFAVHAAALTCTRPGADPPRLTDLAPTT